MNSCTFIGNLTRDVELKDVGESQKAVFAIAVNERYKNKEGKTIETPSFLECEAWGSTGQFMSKYFSKGKPVLLYTKAKQQVWEKDSVKHSRIVFVVEHAEFLPANSPKAKTEAAEATEAAPTKTDEVPF